MARVTDASLRTESPLLGEILDGKHDALIESISHALSIRKKMMFKRGTKVRLSGTRNVEIDGKIATVLKVNATRISVGIGEPKTEYGSTYYPDGEYNVPPRMLEVIA